MCGIQFLKSKVFIKAETNNEPRNYSVCVWYHEME